MKIQPFYWEDSQLHPGHFQVGPDGNFMGLQVFQIVGDTNVDPIRNTTWFPLVMG